MLISILVWLFEICEHPIPNIYSVAVEKRYY